MSGFKWRSLRSAVKQHFVFLPARGYEQVRAERTGLLDASGCIVFHRDGIWVMAARHMDEDFIDLAFLDSTNPLDWFDLEDSVSALGGRVRLDHAPLPHTLAAKAPILERFLPLIEEAVSADRDAFVRDVIAARQRAVAGNESRAREPNLRHSRGA